MLFRFILPFATSAGVWAEGLRRGDQELALLGGIVFIMFAVAALLERGRPA